MRAYLPDYEVKVPTDLSQALNALQEEPGIWQPLAGGTDLMVLFEAGKLAHKKFLSLWGLKELKGIDVENDHVTIGALATYSQIQANELLRKEFPLLCKAASETGAIAIQNRGTLGGNIVNASPAADSPPALLVYDAQVELLSASGSRWIDYVDFHVSYKKTIKRPDEVLSRIRLPRMKPEYMQFYRKVGTRKAQAISKVCFAGLLRSKGTNIEETKIALGSVAPVPLRCRGVEQVLNGATFGEETFAKAREALRKEIAPIDDIRSTSNFRMQVAENLLMDFLQTSTKRVGF